MCPARPATALARLALASLALACAEPAASTCDEPVQDGAVVYIDAYDRIDRFDLAAGLALPSVPAPGYSPYFDAFAVQGDTLWLAFASSRWLVHVDASGAELGRIRIAPDVKAVAAAADHVFALAADSLASYAADTGGIESFVAATGGHRRLLVLPGGRLLLHGYGAPATVPYDADGALGDAEALFPEDLFRVESFDGVSPDGSRLLSGGHVFDAQTLRFGEMLEGGPAAFLGDRVVVAAYDGLRLYDEGRRWIGLAPHPGSVAGTPLAAGDSVWALRCDALAPAFAPVALDSFAPPPALDAPFDPSGVDYEPQQVVMGDEGVVYLRSPVPDGRQLFRFDPAAGHYLPSVPLRGFPSAVSRAPGGGVFVAEGGRVARVLAGAAEEVPFTVVPDAEGSDLRLGVQDAAPWLVAGESRRWHAFGPDGAWQAGFAGSERATAAVWDATRRRLLEHLDPSGSSTALPLSGDGVFGEREPLPTAPPLDVQASLSPDGSRLLAGATLYDAETFEPVATLPASSDRRSLWHGGRLVTLAGELAFSGEESRYAEWTPDGAPLGSLAQLVPGRPLAVLPFGERVVLVRQVGARPVFTVVAPGTGDLDQDGSPDGIDLFPLDPTDWADRDGDGVGDHADPFPDDPTESADSDGDGIGDHGDFLPNVPALAFARLTGKETLGFSGLGRLEADFAGQLHLLAGGGFALCNGPESCLGGGVQPAGSARAPRLELRLAPETLDALGTALEADVERALRGLDVKLVFVATRSNGRIEEGEGGTVRIRLHARHRARIQRVGLAPGAYRVDAVGTFERPPAPAP